MIRGLLPKSHIIRYSLNGLQLKLVHDVFLLNKETAMLAMKMQSIIDELKQDSSAKDFGAKYKAIGVDPQVRHSGAMSRN